MKTITLNKEDIYKGNLIVVNEKLPLEIENKEFYATFSTADETFPEILMEREAASILSYLLGELDSDGQIIPVSGYRSKEEQEQIFAGSLRENGMEFTKKYVALPDHSEHQTGLAIDLGLKKENLDFICPDFPYEGICQKFREKAVNYGFVERYEKGKEYITGIGHEPWHFRYVGYPHSELMRQYAFSLEEYVSWIKMFSYKKLHLKIKKKKDEIEIFYIPATSEKLTVELPEDSLHQISGNNEDGFIVTVWRKEQ